LRVLYVYQPFGEHGKVAPDAARDLQNTVIEGINLAARDRALHLTIRLHPRSSGAAVEDLERSVTAPHTLDRGEVGIEAAITGHDLIIGHYSSALLEAVLLERPIVCVPVPAGAFAEHSEAEKQDWMTRTAPTLARSTEEIAKVLLAFDAGAAITAPPAEIANEVGTVDGTAADRCAAAILQLID
jgi:CDP-glycerol glycerophosphotransferase (TagB/SpsB family)